MKVNVNDLIKGDKIKLSDGLVHEVVRTFKDKPYNKGYLVEFTEGPYLYLVPSEMVEVVRD